MWVIWNGIGHGAKGKLNSKMGCEFRVTSSSGHRHRAVSSWKLKIQSWKERWVSGCGFGKGSGGKPACDSLRDTGYFRLLNEFEILFPVDDRNAFLPGRRHKRGISPIASCVSPYSFIYPLFRIYSIDGNYDTRLGFTIISPRRI